MMFNGFLLCLSYWLVAVDLAFANHRYGAVAFFMPVCVCLRVCRHPIYHPSALFPAYAGEVGNRVFSL